MSAEIAEGQESDGGRPTEGGDTSSVDLRSPPSRVRQILLGLLMVVLIFGFSALAFVLRDQIVRLSSYGYFGLFLIAAFSSASVFIPIPGLALAFATGGALNPLAIGLAVGSGAAVGELTGYLAGYSGRALVENYQIYRRVAGWMERYGMWAVFGLAVIPNPIFDAVGIVSGVLRVPVWSFFAACWAGNTIKATAIALMGLGAFSVLGPSIERWLGK